MNQSRIPEWIERIKEQEETATTRAELQRLQESRAIKTVREEGPKFFREFIESLDLNTAALPTIKLHGNVKKISEDQGDWYWRVTVERRSALYRSKTANIHYAPKGESITFLIPDLKTLIGKPHQLTLCEIEGRIGVVSDDLPAGSSAKEAAESLIRYLADMVSN